MGKLTERTLGECVECVLDYRGKTPKKMGGEWIDDGIRVISALNVHNGSLDNENQIRCVSEEVYKRWMQEDIKRNDCLIVSEGYPGESCIWDSDEKIVLGQRLYAVRTNSQMLDPWYFAYYMQTPKFHEQIRQLSTGSTVFGISQPVLLGIKLLLPDISEQRKIGFFYKNIKRRIENNNRINSELKSLAKTIYDYWFLQYEFPNEEGKPYKSSGGKMVWNEELKREIPENWHILELGELFVTNRGVSYNSKTLEGNGVPMINLASFSPQNEYNVDGIKNYSGDYTDEKIVKPYSLIMCNTQQTAIDFSKDIIGRAMLVPDIFNGQDIVTSHHVNTINTKSDELKFFLLYLFNTDYFHKYIVGFANGTNILGLTFSGVEKYKTEIPDSVTLKKFSDIAQEIEIKKSQIIKENQELTSLRDWLLPLLMNGQVGFSV